MSSSSRGPTATVRLAITANPGTEIAVIDHTFRVCDHGIGTLHTELVPGLYKLRYRAGFTVQEEYQAIEPGDDMITVNAPRVTYSSAAPMPGTRDHEPFQRAASELSRTVHATIGQGSEVFVFTRARGNSVGLSRFTSANPVAGLSLHDREGKRLLKLGKLARRAGGTGQWAGCTVALPPGEYRLRYRPRLAVPGRQELEQVIVASPGWQTQVFLVPSSVERTEDARPSGLAPARTSVLQAKIGQGFDPQRGDARLADLARIGLINGRPIVALPQLLEKLSGESPDPMLGIYTAHAMLQADEFDKDKLRDVVRALRSLLGRHPDVEALASELGMANGYVFDCPPMLTSSWSLILAASARQPGLVPVGSLSEQIATHLWGTGPWLLWLSDGLASAPPPPALADVPDLVAQASDTALLGFPSRRDAAEDPKLDDVEAMLLTHVSRPPGILARRGALEPYGQQASVERPQRPDASGDPDVSKDPALGMSQDLGAALGLPPTAIPQIAASLVRKLEDAAHTRGRFRRLRWRTRGPLARSYLQLRPRKGPGSGRPWRGRWQLQAGPIATRAAVVLSLAVAIGLVSVSFRGSPPGFEIAINDVLSASLALALSLTLGYAVFLRQRSRVHLHRRRARDRPHRTVGSVSGEVVGRDELCQVIIDDLRDRDTRRPHVIVADAGAGKTALLAQLARILAELGAVPVTVRLRDAQHGLDFRHLAHRQFNMDEDTAPLSEMEGETVWRQLLRSDKIVVLADGLEEALVGDLGLTLERRVREREHVIGLALRQAREQRLPLVVTSRPDSSLMTAEATIMELESLDEETALRWLCNGHAAETESLAWLVAALNVAESPLYLQVARQLQVAGLMPEIPLARGHGTSGERDADPMGLRILLLETWMKAVLAGQLAAEAPLSRADRTAAVDQLSVLACVGLERGTREVTFNDFEILRGRKPAPAFLIMVAERLASTGRQFNLGLAALWGTELGVAEAQPSGVRFSDSLIQAYLASRLIGTAMADKPYRSTALTAPGWELLTALVMSSRVPTHGPDGGKPLPDQLAAPGGAPALADLLRERATTAVGVTVLDLYAAALQIDCAGRSSAHDEIAGEIADRWADLTAEDERSLNRAKLHLVRCLGEAAQTVTVRQQADPGYRGKPACRQLYRMAVAEPSHRIRMEIVQQIAACGDAAFGALQDLLGPPADLASPDGTARTPRPPHGRDLAWLTGTHQRQEEYPYDRLWLETVVRAWLAPLLAGSVTSHIPAAQRNLARWLRYSGIHDPGLGPSLEAALAQGFKYAANHRFPQSRSQPQARDFILEQAREMLSGTRFWFARLTLVQALCLLSRESGPARRFGGNDPNYGALVTFRAGLPANVPEHPFVAEARTLAVRALETGQPECFMWIDESTTAATVGPPPADARAPHWHRLWIAPSAGWATLHPSAQKLLAEVQVLLNLAERGSPSQDRIQRLRRAADRQDLPPCLTKDWSALDPDRTVSGARASAPGANCVDGCEFNLCPYPLRGDTAQVELSAAFCRRQKALMSNWEARQFWRQMARRARS